MKTEKLFISNYFIEDKDNVIIQLLYKANQIGLEGKKIINISRNDAFKGDDFGREYIFEFKEKEK